MSEIRTTSSTGGQKGVKLARHDLIPPGPLAALAEHFGMGALKYDSHQWRKGYEYGKSYAALQRHALAWLAGKSYDTCSASDFDGCSHEDSDGNPFVSPREDACYNHTGSHHMAAVAWHAFAIQEFEAEHPEHDDRYRVAGEWLPPRRWIVGIDHAGQDSDSFVEEVSKELSKSAFIVEDAPRHFLDHAFNRRADCEVRPIFQHGGTFPPDPNVAKIVRDAEQQRIQEKLGGEIPVEDLRI